MPFAQLLPPCLCNILPCLEIQHLPLIVKNKSASGSVLVDRDSWDSENIVNKCYIYYLMLVMAFKVKSIHSYYDNEKTFVIHSW